MHNLILELEKTYQKPAVVAVRSGDTVKVTQRIKEANRERLQVFEGLVLRVRRRNSLTYSILVRKIASGLAVEKSFFLHAPNVVKVEIVKRAKVRRNYLSYMRSRVGKAARLKAVDFDKKAVNEVAEIKTTTGLEKETKSQEKEVAEAGAEAKNRDQTPADKEALESDKKVADQKELDQPPQKESSASAKLANQQEPSGEVSDEKKSSDNAKEDPAPAKDEA